MRRALLRKVLEEMAPGCSLPALGRRLRGDPRALEWLRRERRRLRALSRRELSLWRSGYTLVAGVDEAGRGPLAGPLVAAAVTFAEPPFIPGLDDSKKLLPEERQAMIPWIRRQARGVAVAVISPREMVAGNLHRLVLEAMRRCLEDLRPAPAYLLVDGRYLVEGVALPQEALTGGDSRSVSIAAASVLAKVTRDALMVELDRRYPGYGFARHKGYATPEHLEALARMGPCPAHRRSFAPVRESLQGLLDLGWGRGSRAGPLTPGEDPGELP